MNHDERNIQRLKDKILSLCPMLPGSIRKQFNVCGKPGCKCKDPVSPAKHGPYYQLSFSVAGKSSSFFIKEKDLPEARRRIKRFKQFRQLTQELTQSNVDLTRKNGFTRSSS